ncbi:hypothetical protein PR048_014633 [Dryococelus australis]|uniref:Uncharacterized protein n=1 Tax=Dryococelus australis TaxID=614101 RepID=A0ABQ9HEY8_9NEOP|nr:hypothetical protein PR048_014633 [Dryococelus australis]
MKVKRGEYGVSEEILVALKSVMNARVPGQEASERYGRLYLQRRNERSEKTGYRQRNPPTCAIVRHDSHMPKTGRVPFRESNPVRLYWETSSLATMSPRPRRRRVKATLSRGEERLLVTSRGGFNGHRDIRLATARSFVVPGSPREFSSSMSSDGQSVSLLRSTSSNSYRHETIQVTGINEPGIRRAGLRTAAICWMAGSLRLDSGGTVQFSARVCRTYPTLLCSYAPLIFQALPHGRSLGGVMYLQFLQDVLPEYSKDVPSDAREAMWFQQDGVPPHFAIAVRRHLDMHFPNRDEFITPETFAHFRRNMIQRCAACAAEDGGQFEQTLLTETSNRCTVPMPSVQISCSPPTKAILVQYLPRWVTPDFSHVRIVPDDAIVPLSMIEDMLHMKDTYGQSVHNEEKVDGLLSIVLVNSFPDARLKPAACLLRATMTPTCRSAGVSNVNETPPSVNTGALFLPAALDGGGASSSGGTTAQVGSRAAKCTASNSGAAGQWNRKCEDERARILHVRSGAACPRRLEDSASLAPRAVHDKVSTFEINLRKRSLALPAYILTGALSDIRPVKENPPTSDIVRHDSDSRKSGVNRPAIEPGSPWWEASSLTAQPLWPQARNECMWESCWTMPLVGGFFRGSPASSASLHSGASAYSPRFTLIVSKVLDHSHKKSLEPYRLGMTSESAYRCLTFQIVSSSSHTAFISKLPSDLVLNVIDGREVWGPYWPRKRVAITNAGQRYPCCLRPGITLLESAVAKLRQQGERTWCGVPLYNEAWITALARASPISDSTVFCIQSKARFVTEHHSCRKFTSCHAARSRQRATRARQFPGRNGRRGREHHDDRSRSASHLVIVLVDAGSAFTACRTMKRASLLVVHRGRPEPSRRRVCPPLPTTSNTDSQCKGYSRRMAITVQVANNVPKRSYCLPLGDRRCGLSLTHPAVRKGLSHAPSGHAELGFVDHTVHASTKALFGVLELCIMEEHSCPTVEHPRKQDALNANGTLWQP